MALFKSPIILDTVFYKAFLTYAVQSFLFSDYIRLRWRFLAVSISSRRRGNPCEDPSIIQQYIVPLHLRTASALLSISRSGLHRSFIESIGQINQGQSLTAIPASQLILKPSHSWTNTSPVSVTYQVTSQVTSQVLLFLSPISPTTNTDLQ